LPEAQLLGEQLGAPPFHLNGRAPGAAGSRGGLSGLAAEPPRTAEPDLLLGAAELVPPETVSHVQADAVGGVRFGPAPSVGRPVAPAARRVQGDLQILRQAFIARLPVGGHPGLQVLVTAGPPVLRLPSRGQVGQQVRPDPGIAAAVVGRGLQLGYGGSEVEAGSAERGQGDLDRAEAAAEKRRARSPGIDLPQGPDEGLMGRSSASARTRGHDRASTASWARVGESSVIRKPGSSATGRPSPGGTTTAAPPNARFQGMECRASAADRMSP
jgi:hypothetical protein